MRSPFSRTLAFIDGDRRRRVGAVPVGATILLALWIVWLLFSRMTIYAVSEDGRLLAAGAASPVQTPVAGIVAENALVLEKEVHAGDVLVVLDSASERLRLAEEETRIRGLEESIASVETIVAAERALAEANARAGASRVASASARAHAASEIASLTKQQDDAMRRLRDASLATGLEALRSAEEMQRQRGQLAISGADAVTANADLERIRRETDVRLSTLARELTELRARIAASRSIVAQLEWEIARRSLRSPVDGTVADVASIPKGSTVGANQMLATVIPRAKMRWVAWFSPRDAVGRLRAGQRARIRLDAFPWTAYGALDARVVSVGSEPRDQRVRVELEIEDGAGLPLAHGMTGTADVQTEELSPFRALLRAIGRAGQVENTNPPVAPAEGASAVAAAQERR